MTADPMHRKLIRRAQRHVARPPQAEPPPAAFEALADRVGKISAVVAEAYKADNQPVPCWLDDVDLSTVRTAPTNAPGHPESLTAELPEAQEIALAALSNDLWPHDEYLDITAEDEPS